MSNDTLTKYKELAHQVMGQFNYDNTVKSYPVQFINGKQELQGVFNYNSLISNSIYLPEIPEYIIEQLTNKTMSKNNNTQTATQNTENNVKSQNNKQMETKKKSSFFGRIGKGIVTGTCKTLGGAHLVIQTTADMVACTEAGIRAVAFGEDKTQAFFDRVEKTQAHQEKIAHKIEAIHNKAKSMIEEAKQPEESQPQVAESK